MILRLLSFSLAALLLLSCAEEEEERLDESGFDEQTLLDERLEKDKLFAGSDESPIPAEQRASFSGLVYYAPDSTYCIDADLEIFATRDTIEMQTSIASDVRKAVRIGRFTGMVKGSKVALTAYSFLDGQEDQLFVPFTDKTSGFDSYESGRYLDIERHDDEDYIIDFNRAYNPYCAYNSQYVCPLVPPENRLTVSIRAGEKRWH